MKHEINLVKSLFARVKDGSKNFIIKDSDHRFQKGDDITLKEWDDDVINATTHKQKGLTGQELKFKIGFVEILSGSQVCFSLLPSKTKA